MSRSTRLIAVLATSVLAVAGCASNSSNDSGGSATSGPQQITMWARAANAKYNQAAVDAYNATSKDKVKLTSIPDADFLTKLSTATASGQTPDLVAADVVYVPKLLQTNQLRDLTSTVNGLDFKDSLAPSYLKAATKGGKIFAVPQNPDASALFYNKDLFKQAGLDPQQPPTTWQQIAQDAAKISALGGGVKGYYFSGNCAGCNAYTFIPMIWASGSNVLADDGTSVAFDTPQMKAGLSFYHELFSGGNVPAGAKTDTGANFLAAFQTGKVGIEGLGAFAVGALASSKIDYGVAPLPGQNGGTASFAGGDMLAIPSKSSHSAQAADFITWFLSEKTQVEVVAKGGGMTARIDLADNKYATATPALVEINKLLASARTPNSVQYNELFNDPNGPWATAFQKAVFGGDISAVTAAQQQMDTILQAGK